MTLGVKPMNRQYDGATADSPFPQTKKKKKNPVSFFPFIRFRPGKLVVGLKGNLRVSEAAFLRRWVFSDRRKEKNRKIGAFCRLGIHEI